MLAINKHATVAEFYAEFDAWAKTASVADVVAILETQSAIDTQTAGVFDLSTATEGTDHDPCGSATQWPPSPPPAPPSPPPPPLPPPLSAGSSLSGVVSAVVAAATVVLAGTGRA